MSASEFSPLGLALASVCGGSTPEPVDTPTSTGFSCSDYNLMIKVELLVGLECVVDEGCRLVSTRGVGPYGGLQRVAESSPNSAR